jgi:hypothetical protein
MQAVRKLKVAEMKKKKKGKGKASNKKGGNIKGKDGSELPSTAA